MRLIVRALSMAILGFALGGLSLANAAFGAGVSEGTASRAGSLFSDALVLPAVDQLLGGEGARAARSARRSSPEAVAARTAARSSFEGLTPSQAAGETRSAFPDLIDQPAGTVPHLSAGQRIVSYPTDHAAQVSFSGGTGVVESLAPIARRTSHGRHVPFDLRLRKAGGHYEPVRPDVAVNVPVELSKGVALPAVGVSLTPVDENGSPLPAPEGELNGAAVIWGHSNGDAAGVSDLSTVAKASLQGFDLTTVLLSQRSPGELYFRVGMPAGAHLESVRGGSVRVKKRNATLAVVAPVSAEDAEGTNVPVSMRVHGGTLELTVDLAGDYLYPIAVDPEINDAQLATTTAGKHSNWEFHTSNSSRFAGNAVYEGVGNERLETKGIATYSPGEWAYWGYQTKGNSKIYELKTQTSAKNKNAKIESFLEFAEPGGAQETRKLLSTELSTPEYENKVDVLCAANAGKEECLPAAGKAKNVVRFQQSATASPGGSYGFLDTMSQGIVSISEPAGTHSTTSLNTTSPELTFEVENEGKKEKITRQNILYGAGGWLTKQRGAFETIAKDPGIGVSATKLEYESSAGKWDQLAAHNYLENENACQGVQCYETHGEDWTFVTGLPDGEDKIRYKAEEAMSGTQSLETEGKVTVKVDTKPPHGIELNGLPYGNEMSERPYKLSAEAIDGEGSSTASAGVKSLALFVSGHEVAEEGKQAGCVVLKGQCTATASWSLNGAELGAGHHAIVIVATDNAGNESRLEETISIRHSTPVRLGPGSLDLQSGDFSLGTTDASFGSGLTSTRAYSSRALDAGEEGPLGPQWSLSMASTQSLVEMVDGSILLTEANGKQSIFASLGEGKFEAPVGDSNLTLTLEENKTTKQKLAYYLEKLANHTKTKFTLPSGGTKVWVPTKQEGAVATDTVTYAYQAVEQSDEYPVASGAGNGPNGIIAGPDGNTWYTTSEGHKLGKVTSSGVVTEYSLAELHSARAITAGSDGNLWFTEPNPSRINRIDPSGKITEFNVPWHGVLWRIAAGPTGDLWFSRTTEGSIGKMTTAGVITEYTTPAGAEFYAIAKGPDGNMWFTDKGKGVYSAIWKVTSAGVMTKYTLPLNSGPTAIAAGPDGNVWFTDAGTSKVGKITTSGVITEYSVPKVGEESDLEGIASGSDGNLWFTDMARHKIGKITTSGTLTQYEIPASSKPSGITSGPDGKVWYTDMGQNKIGTMTTAVKVTEPTEALAPVPAGVSCAPEMKAGCRALKYQYASSTTATGRGAEEEWGDYKGRLTKILLEAYDPVGKKMSQTAVAQYTYDNVGQLRAEWDPRISPALKTRYGYDEYGHLTALNSPGQEPSLFTYGTAAGDSGLGRLVKLIRPKAEIGLWGGKASEVVKSSEAPKLSGRLATGWRVSVSNGTWTGGPTTYGYQWEDCGVGAMGPCTPIPGATNANYFPVKSDVGHTLAAVVTATNGGGSASATAYTLSGVVVETDFKHPFEVIEYPLPTGSKPYGVAASQDSNMWFTDSGTGKVGKITKSGVMTEYATESIEPKGITLGPETGAERFLWFVDHASKHVDQIEQKTGILTGHEWWRANPGTTGIVSGFDKKLWFTETNLDRIGSMTISGEIGPDYAVPAGSKPYGLAVGSDKNLWFTNEGKAKIGKMTTAGVITEYTLTSTAYGITAGPDSNLWFTEAGANKVGKITTAGVITLYTLPAGSSPHGITTGSDGNLWVAESGTSKLAKVTTSGTVTEYALPSGSTPEGLASGTEGNVWFTEYGTNKVGKIDPHVFTEGEYVAPQTGTTIEYGVPLSGSGLPTMTASEVEKWGQKDTPAESTAIVPPDSPQGWPATSYTRATLYYLDGQGRNVNVSVPSNAPYGSVATTEYNEYNDVVRTLSPNNRQAALEAGAASVEVSKLRDTQNTYNGEGAKEGEVEEPGTRLIDTVGPQHQIKYVAGTERKESLAREHTKYFYNEGAPAGEHYDLVTKKTDLAQLANEEEVEVRKTTTSYSGQSNLGWKLRGPTSVVTDPEGKKSTHTTLYDATTGQITETRSPAGGAGESAHDQKTIYYSTAANGTYPTCGGHPEWAGLPCETLPAKQPETAGLPKLPVTVVTYNRLNEPLTITETFGSTTRTKTRTYDEAGRLVTSETTSTANTALPKVTNEYSATIGLLEKQSTTVESTTKTITSKYNTLGEITEYVDADGNTAKYKYGTPENGSLLEEMSDGSAGGTGKQTYSYDAVTKQMVKETDSAAGIFTASYDAEGRIATEVYPNEMCANSTYNSVGEATRIEYVKTTNCSIHEPVWYSETRIPSVRGETFSRTSTLASENYTYDTLGRLTEAQETPAGEGCRSRSYAYDEESNRTSLTTRNPNGKGECVAEGGTVENHTYDEANRLTDAGVAYDNLDNVTKLPAADAEGHELSSTFYVDNAIATQTQNGVTNNYYLDPEGRVRETVTGVSAAISHYDGPGEAVAWTSGPAGATTRNIPGIDGSLAATQTNGETPILQLRDLQGNAVATAALSPTAPNLLSTYNSTEFGVPNSGKTPPKFAWLGAAAVASALPSGVITYGSMSYVPQIGRALQSQSVEPPGSPEGTGAGAAYTFQEEPWVMQGAARAGGEAPGLEAAREKAAAEAALAAAIAAAGEGVDPVQWYTKYEARVVGAKFLEIASWTEVISLIGSIPSELRDVVEGVIADKISLDFALDWYHKAGQKLTQCGNEKKPWVSCKFMYRNWHLGVSLPVVGTISLTLVNLFSGPETEKCTAKPVVFCSRLNS